MSLTQILSNIVPFELCPKVSGKAMGVLHIKMCSKLAVIRHGWHYTSCVTVYMP